MTAVLEAHDLDLRLDRRAVLHGVSLALSAGRWTAVVGPNGAGKSTLLRVLAGLARPQAGTLTLDGRPLHAQPVRQRAQRIAWLPQRSDDAGADALTVRELVALGRLPWQGLMGDETAADLQAVEQALAQAGCEAWAERRVGELSGGERQRVALARVLATQAAVLLLDEPAAHQDPPQQAALLQRLRALTLVEGRAVACVLHEPTLALQADALLVMQAGRVLAEGPPADAAVRAAMAQAFGGALRIERLDDRWVALPKLG